MTSPGSSNCYDLIILGAGPSGLMCAAEAAGGGVTTLLVDHRKLHGGKLLASGGGACNITNRQVEAVNFRSENPHFSRSALSRFGSHETLQWFASGGIDFEEREEGRVFTCNGSEAVVRLLNQRCRDVGVDVNFGSDPGLPEYRDGMFYIPLTERGSAQGGHMVQSPKLVVALGSSVRPDLGAGDLGYRIARSFGHRIVPVEPALTRLRWPLESGGTVTAPVDLSGISLTVEASCGGKVFTDELLFAHRGISGPAAFQISLWWKSGDVVQINLLPGLSLTEIMEAWRREHPARRVKSLLSELLPRRLVEFFLSSSGLQGWGDKKVAESGKKESAALEMLFQKWSFIPSEKDPKVAEVCVGGVDTRQVDSKSFESKLQPGLYFIGEVLDVTGELGGYNLQWAWSSGWCCGTGVGGSPVY